MGKVLWLFSAVVVLLACSMWRQYPENVERRYLRGFIDGLGSTTIRTLLILERNGFVSSAVDLFRNVATLPSKLGLFLAERDDSVEESIESFGGVEVLKLKPKQLESPSRAIIYFHGGGFVLCDIWAVYIFTRKLAADSRSIVLSVNYRLAPEFGFPSALEDGLSVTRDVVRRAGDLGVDPKRIFLAGDSAGGNLAVSVAMRMSQSFKFRGVALISPWLQMANLVLPSYQLNTGYFTVDINWLFANFAGLNSYSADVERILKANHHVPIEFQKEVAKFFKLFDLGESLRINDMIVAKDTPFPLEEKIEVVDETNKKLVADINALTKLATNKEAWPLIADNSDLLKLTSTSVYIQYDRFDILRDEAILFAHRLRGLGIKVRTNYVRNGLHDEPVLMYFQGIGETLAGIQAIEDVVSFIEDSDK